MDEHEALLPKNKTRVVERGPLKTILIAFCGAAVRALSCNAYQCREGGAVRLVAGERLGHGRPREARGDQGEDRPSGPLPVPEVRWIQGAHPRPVSTHATKREHTNKILPSPTPTPFLPPF